MTSPYYPRGTIRAVDPLIDTHAQQEEEDDDLSGDDIVHADRLPSALRDLVQSAALNNMATLHLREGGEWEANGDSTEIALQVFAHKAGHGKPHLSVALPPSNH